MGILNLNSIYESTGLDEAILKCVQAASDNDKFMEAVLKLQETVKELPSQIPALAIYHGVSQQIMTAAIEGILLGLSEIFADFRKARYAQMPGRFSVN